MDLNTAGPSTQAAVNAFDQSLLSWINQKTSNPFFDWLFPAITDLHKATWFKFGFLALFLIIFLAVWKKRGIILIFSLVLCLSITDWFGSLLKHYFMRPRPFEILTEVVQRSPAGGYSFPSNHAANTFCLAVFMSAFFPRLRWPFFILAILISYSRIYNGVHFPTDVLAGALLGVSVGLIAVKLLKRGLNV